MSRKGFLTTDEHGSCGIRLNRSNHNHVWFGVLKRALIPLFFLSFSLLAEQPSKVTFDPAGNALINGKPFFPVGIFNYSPNTDALVDIRERGFNTIVAITQDHKPEHLDLMFRYGLRIICPPNDLWFEPARKHPGLLAWYLADEPEGHGQTPAALREKYLQLKLKDPNHPVALDHFLLDSLLPYKDAADVTMTSYYPLLAGGGPALENFAVYLDKARAIHGHNWPHWPFIQIFGGPNTDGGKWKQPEPDEVRCLVYLALVHRAQGIFYFSYWPQAPKTWAAVGNLNCEIRTLTPWIVGTGSEVSASSTNPAVHVRARQLTNSTAGLLIAVNTTHNSVQTELSVSLAAETSLRPLFNHPTPVLAKGKMATTLAPYQSLACVWGAEPKD